MLLELICVIEIPFNCDDRKKYLEVPNCRLGPRTKATLLFESINKAKDIF